MGQDYKHIHKAFKLNGKSYTAAAIIIEAQKFSSKGEPFEKLIGAFLLDWLNNDTIIVVNTSGSTGIPKNIILRKQAMVNSAVSTGLFFNLKPGDKALHCLPANFIAGKMMLVRALILGLEIDCIQPSSKLNIDVDKDYDFSAMIPLQLQNSFHLSNAIKTIIVGGAQVSNALKEVIQKMKPTVFETYGMTETITHIALKPLNKASVSNYFKVLPNIMISQDVRDCLVISAPHLSENTIITNDIVKIHSESTFEWIGRFDTIINSGGLKMSPELIEAKLDSVITERFFIASEPDELLGQKLILVIEANHNNIDISSFDVLDKHERPKHVYTLARFSETETGKIHRKKTLESIKL